MKIAEEDIGKTCFKTKFVRFQLTVVPFGLAKAPAAAFMTMMDNVVNDYSGKFFMAYLDDIKVIQKL